jgi:very-short-patch-repair endonuclease
VFDRGEVDALLLRHRGRPGTRRLAIAVELQRDDPPMTRSGLERQFLELVRDAGLPRPSLNATVLGYEVDFLWVESKLIAETDTHVTHGSAEAFERDRERDADLQVAGYRVVRFTDRQIERDTLGVLAKLRALLGPRAGAPRPADRAAS